MTVYTSRLTLPSPQSTESPNGPVQIAALTAVLDPNVAYDAQGNLASRPVSTPANPGIRGRYYFVTGDSDSTQNNRRYRDFGTGWIEIGAGGAAPYLATIGDGTATTIDVTHSLATRDLSVTVRQTVSPYAEVYPRVEFTTLNAVRFIFDVAPTSGQYAVVINGKGGTVPTVPSHATSHNPGGTDSLNYVAIFTSPALTGTPTAPTATAGTSTTQVSTTAFVSTAIALKADLSSTINAQTGTTYTLALADAGVIVALANAAAITVTVPPNSSVAFPIGTTIELIQDGAGLVTVAAGAGVTIKNAGRLKLNGQDYAATLVKRATDTWNLIGGVA
jgi:hypothetical protein